MINLIDNIVSSLILFLNTLLNLKIFDINGVTFYFWHFLIIKMIIKLIKKVLYKSGVL